MLQACGPSELTGRKVGDKNSLTGVGGFCKHHFNHFTTGLMAMTGTNGNEKPLFFIFLLLCVSFLTGCGRHTTKASDVPRPPDEDTIESRIKVEKDEHIGMINIMGPLMFTGKNYSGHMYLLRASVDSSNPDNNMIQVYLIARGFHTAPNLKDTYSHGRRFKTISIDHDVRCRSYGCDHSETVGIMLSATDLDMFAKSGFSFRVYGSGGQVDMTIPASYFAAFRKVFLRVVQNIAAGS